MMDSPSRFDTRARRWVGLAILAGGLIGILAALTLDGWGRRTLFDAWQRTAPRDISADKVAVVLIDNASIKTVGPWPWPRYYMARLTEQIALAKPKVIAFDMIFYDADAVSPRAFASLYPELTGVAAESVAALPDMDEAFAQVVGSAPVLLPRLGVDHDGIDPKQVLIDPEIVGSPPANTHRTRQIATSLPQLDDMALAHAVINGPPDTDGTVRRVPLTVIAGGRAMPGIAVELARMAKGAAHLEWRGDDLMLGDAVLPSGTDGSLALRMGLFPLKAIYRADEVLTGRFAPEALRGKVVLIGMGADGTSDIVPTPISNSEMGVLVQAQAVDAILSRGWLARPPWAPRVEAGIALLLLGAVLLAGYRRRNAILIVAVILAIALPFVSLLLFDRANLVFDPIPPLLVGAFAAVALGIARFAVARAERARLAAELVEQRVASAEQEGELRAARRIQIGMVPSADRLAALAPEADIGAVLLPAKSVGGDYYDAALISPGHLLVVIADVTGKGVPAALFMALSKALSKSVLSRGAANLGAAMAQLNRDLMAEADDEMGVTMLAGVLDCATGALQMVNAGHENPIVVRRDGSIEVVPMRGGPPLCVVDFPYPTEELRLARDETLVLITDGATEAQNAGVDLFGVDGVVSALMQQEAATAPDRVRDLAERVRAFEGDTDPSDDLTIFALRWRGVSG
jgi:serine phosphatase RsbU (regulator of sigma subunit)/CHASE2 domain-containing sensor protein